MKMLDVGGRGGSKIGKFCSRNGFESKKSSNRSMKVVAKGLGEASWTENGATLTRAPGGRHPGREVGGMDKSIPDGCIQRI